ncbi:hypothetical protein CYMTET_47907 [Cymbomonas tetramitiformis]|uniref:Uncharacterized protein n=1 Tax=Cymbomonas tetramitiformis TaxID=36881 RepID=A0AAE0BV65_9CHLO|nr:hypothetical protein CYMTET_47907 [Cymbomonas tetramitiformis]
MVARGVRCGHGTDLAKLVGYLDQILQWITVNLCGNIICMVALIMLVGCNSSNYTYLCWRIGLEHCDVETVDGSVLIRMRKSGSMSGSRSVRLTSGRLRLGSAHGDSVDVSMADASCVNVSVDTDLASAGRYHAYTQGEVVELPQSEQGSKWSSPLANIKLRPAEIGEFQNMTDNQLYNDDTTPKSSTPTNVSAPYWCSNS